MAGRIAAWRASLASTASRVYPGIDEALVDCLVVTDNRDRSDHFFDVGTQFAGFDSMRGASRVMSSLLAHRGSVAVSGLTPALPGTRVGGP